jgi:hypothetical protein
MAAEQETLWQIIIIEFFLFPVFFGGTPSFTLFSPCSREKS